MTPHKTTRYAALLLVLLSACGGEKPVTPQEAFERFFVTMRAYNQDPEGELQRMALEMLSAASRERLNARAATINEGLPEGAKIEPSELLVSRGTPRGTRIVSTEVLDQSEDHATLHVVFDAGEAQVNMVREEGHWKVVLPDPPPM